MPMMMPIMRMNRYRNITPLLFLMANRLPDFPYPVLLFTYGFGDALLPFRKLCLPQRNLWFITLQQDILKGLPPAAQFGNETVEADPVRGQFGIVLQIPGPAFGHSSIYLFAQLGTRHLDPTACREDLEADFQCPGKDSSPLPQVDGPSSKPLSYLSLSDNKVISSIQQRCSTRLAFWVDCALASPSPGGEAPVPFFWRPLV